MTSDRARALRWGILASALAAAACRSNAAPAEPPAAVESLPYLNFVPVEPQLRSSSGTTIWNRSRARAGDNLFVPKPHSEALLIDMQGRVVHRWSSSEGQPDAALAGRLADMMLGWDVVAPVGDGGLLAAVGRHSLLRLDAASQLLWEAPLPVHHDIELDASGNIYTLTEEIAAVEQGGKRRLVLDDGVAVLAPDGHVRRRISLARVFSKRGPWAELFRNELARRYARVDQRGLDASVVIGDHPDMRPPAATVERIRALFAADDFGHDQREAISRLFDLDGFPPDVFHANAVVPLDPHGPAPWKRGDLLVSIRNLNRLVVIDEHDDIVWSWGPGVLEHQHQPSVLSNGHLLVFDNGNLRHHSRVLEIDPLTEAIVWSYDPGKPRLFSVNEGGCQALDNGDILITETRRGRVFEVTRDKEVVWEWLNPDFLRDERATLYRMTRLVDVHEGEASRR